MQWQLKTADTVMDTGLEHASQIMQNTFKIKSAVGIVRGKDTLKKH